MKTITDFDVTVDTRELRGALMAAVPHMCSDKDMHQLRRIRVYVTPAGLQVAATDRYTMAAATVDVQDTTGVLGVFDLSPDHVSKLLTIFKPGKDEDASLRLEVTEKRLTATDVSGMFPGEQLAFAPTPVHVQFPDVGRILHDVWQRRCATVRAAVSGEYLARFRAAARALDATLRLEPAADGTALMVSGYRFAGAVMCIREDVEDVDRHERDRARWLDRLGPMSDANPAPPPPPDRDDDEDLPGEPWPVDLTTVLDDEAGDL